MLQVLLKRQRRALNVNKPCECSISRSNVLQKPYGREAPLAKRCNTTEMLAFVVLSPSFCKGHRKQGIPGEYFFGCLKYVFFDPHGIFFWSLTHSSRPFLASTHDPSCFAVLDHSKIRSKSKGQMNVQDCVSAESISQTLRTHVSSMYVYMTVGMCIYIYIYRQARPI